MTLSRSSRWAIGLSLATLITSLFAGGAFAGAAVPWRVFFYSSPAEIVSILQVWIVAGIPYALSLMLFFVSHELGHYVACRLHGVNCTPPFFIPAPPPFPFGTLGAVIRIRSPIYDRCALFDIGIAGPIAGFVVAIPVLCLGILRSTPSAEPLPQLGLTTLSVLGEAVPAVFGDSLLTVLLKQKLVGDVPGLVADPLLISGWLALLATAMNLIPAGQFDGGHIVYAVAPRWHKTISYCSAFFLIALVGTRMVMFGESSAWLAWAVIVLIFGRRHPPVPYPHLPIGRVRVALAIVAGVMLLLCFAPHPIQVLVY